MQFVEAHAQQIKAQGIEDVESFVVSPRDGEKLVVLYGKEIVIDGPGGLPWVAYEKTGLAGKRIAIGARGVAREMDPSQFAEVFENGS